MYNYWNKFVVKIDSPSDIIHGSTRKCYAMALLGSNTIQIIDDSNFKLKMIFGIPYSTTAYPKNVKTKDGFNKYL